MDAKEYFKKNKPKPEFQGNDGVARLMESYHQAKSMEEAEDLVKLIDKQCKTYFIEDSPHSTEPVYLKYDVIETIRISSGKEES